MQIYSHIALVRSGKSEHLRHFCGTQWLLVINHNFGRGVNLIVHAAGRGWGVLLLRDSARRRDVLVAELLPRKGLVIGLAVGEDAGDDVERLAHGAMRALGQAREVDERQMPLRGSDALEGHECATRSVRLFQRCVCGELADHSKAV